MKELLMRLIMRNQRVIPQVFMDEEEFLRVQETYDDISDIFKRVQTFCKNGWTSEVSIIDLSDAGFFCYQHENENRVVCFSCRGTIANWEKGAIPVKVHRKVYPECEFAIRKVNKIRGKRTQFDNPQEKVDSDTEDEIDDMHFFESEFNRLMSFKKWPLSSFVDRYDLASSGFYCTDETKTVICVGCFVQVSDWNLGDRPQSRHTPRVDGSPCPFADMQNEEKASKTVEIQQFIRSECALALQEC